MELKIPTILLLGKNGQVGWELNRSLLPLGNLIALDRTGCDLSKPDEIPAVISKYQPDIIVNAAAYTAVDKAEEEEALATTINGTAVGVLAEEAKKHNALLIHYSTDYVFDGTKPTPYTEKDVPNPINAYGRSKWVGEEAIKQSGCNHLIFRTSWVYAARGKNFIKTMLRLAMERDELKVVADQYGAPTSAELIADVTALILYRMISDPLLAKQLSGTYHLTAAGNTSWHGYTQWLLEAAIECGQDLKILPDQVIPIITTDYLLPAKRPMNSSLATVKLRSVFRLMLPHWEMYVARTVLEVYERHMDDYNER